MGQSTIQSSINSLPFIPSKPVTREDIASMPPEGHFATRQFIHTTAKETAINIETAEGDKVTLTYQTDNVDVGYLRPAGMTVPGLVDAEQKEESLSISVAGDLSEEEQADILALADDLNDLIDRVSAGGQDGSKDQPLNFLSKYDSLKHYDMTSEVTRSSGLADEMTIVPERLDASVNTSQKQETGLEHLQQVYNSSARISQMLGTDQSNT
ncbi:MAG: hypothetical protein MI802_25555 [Desulfobacterales bacterium]|nr:hypothetical protein [Desulfobacterales bacterium]